jgi:[acyl-carrier-protein] S-malonyltransferase
MNAYIFPGQGSQHPGMGQLLFDQFDQAKALFRRADEILGYSISDVMFHGTEEQLKQTKYTQLAMFLHGYIAYECLHQAAPDMTAGHSLGEYTALTAAGCLRFEDALQLVEKRANAMQKACEKTESGMAVILKFDDKTIEEVCASITEEVVVPANYNSQQQLVISGSVKGLELAVEKLKEAGAKRIMMLNVGGAFHSPLMQTAQDELAEAIEKCVFNTPTCPVYQNVNASAVTDPDQIRQNLVAQLTAPVRWTQTVLNMVQDGADHFVEFGPAPTLGNLVKRIVPEMEAECLGTDTE